jgi:hypothetical protein
MFPCSVDQTSSVQHHQHLNIRGCAATPAMARSSHTNPPKARLLNPWGLERPGQLSQGFRPVRQGQSKRPVCPRHLAGCQALGDRQSDGKRCRRRPAKDFCSLPLSTCELQQPSEQSVPWGMACCGHISTKYGCADLGN